jgi:histone-lysine N-methyltransferase SETD3
MPGGEDGARLARLRALATWLEAQPGASAAWGALQLADCGESGYGFRAVTDVVQGSLLCSIPVRLAWSALAARVSPALGPLLQRCAGLRDDDVLGACVRARALRRHACVSRAALCCSEMRAPQPPALLLLHERSQGAASQRWAHLASLPAAYDATVFWSEAELADLRGSPLWAQTQALRAQTEADHRELHTALLEPNAALFPPDACDLEAYRWALATIWSRAMDLPTASGGTMRVIAPWADLFNNDPTLPVCHAHERSGNAVVVLAGRDYAAGEVVHINYGCPSAAAALRLHGFLPQGALVEVPVFAEMAPEADLYDAKRHLLDAAGVPVGSGFVLTLAEPLPATLLLALRVQRLTAAEIAAAERDGLKPGARVSADNERAALGALQQGLRAMLEAYPTSAERDEALLGAENAASMAPRARAAVELRLGEKRVLLAALEELALQLSAVDQGSSDDDEEPPTVEEAAAVAMAVGKAPEAAAELAAYFESLLAEEGKGEGEGAGRLDGLD